MAARAGMVIGAMLVAIAVAIALFGRGAGDEDLIVIVRLMRHPIFDEVVAATRAAIHESTGGSGRVKIVELNANGEVDKLATLATEALALKPSVIVSVSTPVTLAVMKAAPPEQRIVFTFVANPSAVGMDARPANLTGVSDQVNYEGNVKLARDLFPAAKRLGMIYNPGEPNSRYAAGRTRAATEAVGLELLLTPVSKSIEVPDAIRALEGRVDSIYVGSDNTVVAAMPGLIAVANKSRIPVIASEPGSVAAGALAAISVDYDRVGRETGEIVVRLLRDPSLSPSRIPHVLIEGGDLILNSDSAQTLGYRFAPEVTARAAKIIGKDSR
jgi:putative ABC transport system substrate-binding protein